MLRFMLAIALASSSVALAVEPELPKPAITIECHGVLKDGVVAIGGETTGTTVTVGQMTLELNLNDDAKRTFAKEHDKQQVLVTGSLRLVTGTQIAVRWVVDVVQLSVAKEAAAKTSVLVTATGKLRTAEGIGKDSGLLIDVKGVTWPLSFSKESPLETKAQKLLQKIVVVRGEFEPTDVVKPSQLNIRVAELQAAAESRSK